MTSAGPASSTAPILRAFTEELVRAGVREAVICPGSRSTPLALALSAHDGITTRVLLDERSAGFFALGMATTSGRAVVLLGTSGTAVVNFAPAVVEASLARVPLGLGLGHQAMAMVVLAVAVWHRHAVLRS